MGVLKAIGAFFAKVGRWIKDTAWVQPLLIVGAIFGLIFAIPKIVEAVEYANTDAVAAQAFWEKNEINSQGKEDHFSEGTSLDKFFTILEDTTSTKEEVFDKVDDVLGLNGNKQFFLIFVDSSSSSDNLYGGLNYLRKNWKNDEFKDDLGSSEFAVKTVYIDRIDKYDEKTNLLSDCYNRHDKLFEQLSTDLSYTQYAINREYTDGYYDKFVAEDYSTGLYNGTIFFFNFEATGYANVETKGLRSCFLATDIVGTTDYERAQSLFYAWIEKNTSIYGVDYVK